MEARNTMEATTIQKPQSQNERTLEKIRPDLNLEKWSIWQPARSRNKKSRVLRREIENQQGDKITAEVTIGYVDRIGTLTTEDQKTFYALVDIWEKKGKPEGETPLSLRNFAKVHKKNWGTNVIDASTKSLVRIRAVPIILVNAYYDSTKKQTVETIAPFNLLSDLKIIKRSENGHVTKEQGYFKFNDFILKNLLNNHTKPVLFDVVLSFKSEIAQLLYTHLDLIMARRDHYERKTRELFFDDLGLEGIAYKNASKRKQNLLPALKELQGVQLSTGYITSIKLERTKDDKDFKLVVDKDEQQQLALIAELQTDEGREVVQPLQSDEPTTLGKQARDLVNHFHKLFHHSEVLFPSSKAIGQATALIAQHGNDLACFIVDYAHIEAPKTDYHPQTFGGILQYSSRALADHDCSQRRKEAEAHEREARRKAHEEEQIRRHYEDYRQERLGEVRAAMPPDELAALEQVAVAQFDQNDTNLFGRDHMRRLAIEDALAAHGQIPSFEEWQALPKSAEAISVH